jgi:hypothetical protein
VSQERILCAVETPRQVLQENPRDFDGGTDGRGRRGEVERWVVGSWIKSGYKLAVAPRRFYERTPEILMVVQMEEGEERREKRREEEESLRGQWWESRMPEPAAV